MLMLTWSSLFADVGIVSTLAGCASVFSSDVSAAAVTCAIISPDCRPPCRVRNAGRPLSAGLTSRSERRSLIVASWARPRHSRSAAIATGAPWKLPPDTISRAVGEHHRVVGGGIGLDVEDVDGRTRQASRAAPWTCGAQRIE